MKKNELLHVHSLLLAVARQFTDRDVVADGALDSYRETVLGESTETDDEHSETPEQVTART